MVAPTDGKNKLHGQSYKHGEAGESGKKMQLQTNEEGYSTCRHTLYYEELLKVITEGRIKENKTPG